MKTKTRILHFATYLSPQDKRTVRNAEPRRKFFRRRVCNCQVQQKMCNKLCIPALQLYGDMAWLRRGQWMPWRARCPQPSP